MAGVPDASFRSSFPWEQALIGTPVADPQQPVEILRTIHSFDPCMSCAVHLMDTTGREITQMSVLPND